jgi:hypothetical protein
VLFHVSEEPGIVEFKPRPSKYTPAPMVWAVNDEKIRNYLLPRDCPRVTYYAGTQTVPEDSARFLGTSAAVVAIEAIWWNRIRAFRLYSYHLPSETFECIDECAGYFVSRESVRPLRIEVIEDPIAAMLARGVELRILPTLDPLRDSVVASTLQFSIIRMRNANAGHLPSPVGLGQSGGWRVEVRRLGADESDLALETLRWLNPDPQRLLQKLQYFDIADQIDTIVNGERCALPGQREASWQRLRQCLS